MNYMMKACSAAGMPHVGTDGSVDPMAELVCEEHPNCLWPHEIAHVYGIGFPHMSPEEFARVRVLPEGAKP